MIVKWILGYKYTNKSTNYFTVPQDTEIDDDDLVNCNTEEEKNKLIDYHIQQDFDKRISWTKFGNLIAKR